MKKLLAGLGAVALACCLTACASAEAPSEQSRPDPQSQAQPESQPESPQQSPAKEDDLMQARTVLVTANGVAVTFELNDSAAASTLLSQLPLTVEFEDFSTNEKIFYPSQSLDVSDAPRAEGGAGTLAYYEPWGDVVMFYGDYTPSGDLYEVGRATSGADGIEILAGTITIAPAV